MTAASHRLSILTDREIDDLYARPRFTQEDRFRYFQLSPTERLAVGEVRTAAVHFALQLGYFKAKQQFFAYTKEDVREDLLFLRQHHFPERAPAVLRMPFRHTRLQQQRRILQLFDYRLCNGLVREELEAKAQRLAMRSTQPVYLLREMLEHLHQQRIVLPAYTVLQDMVGRVISGELDRVTRLLEEALSPALEQQLDALLQADEGMYRISAYKHEPKSFTYQQLHHEVERRRVFQPLNEFAATFLETAGLSQESAKYYASLVKYYTVYKLRRMAPATARLYLLCYAYYRFRQINDHLVEAFIHWVDHYEAMAKQTAEEARQQALAQAQENLQAAGQVLTLFVDPSIPAETPFAEVKQQAFALLAPEQFPTVSQYMGRMAFDKTAYEWQYYTRLSLTFKRNLRHLFSDIAFAGRVEETPLMEAVAFLQGLLRQDKAPRQAPASTFPLAVIPKSLQRYLWSAEPGQSKCLEVDRYEFLLYRLLRNALEAGDVFVQESNEFRRFEDDLISDARWQDKDALLRETGAPLLLAPIRDTLQAFEQQLEARFVAVNQRIQEGTNKHVKIRGSAAKRRWRLIYPSEDEGVNHPFYAQLPGIGIADLLWFVAERTGFLHAFTHVLDRFVKHDPDPHDLLAGLVALGTNMGLWKMAEVSGLDYAALLTTAHNYLRLETLHAANDFISNAIAGLSVFPLYDIDEAIHSSSDGQHLEVQTETFNARHSPKYFGLHKGVVSYTLVANHVPINAKVIGAHEHESYFVFDLLYNNTSDIQPERHSTDTHGTNQVNFFLLYVFGYRFAPRYKDLHKKVDGLVGFQHPGHYGEMLLKPARKVYTELIEREWPNIQRILASLAQKEVTQATIVRKLASYERQNQTKKALWELENICRTLYILDVVDDVELRQDTQKALNRGEAYHRLRRAVAYVNRGKFRVKTEAEQQIWNECSRLLTNAILYYNSVLLSGVYEQKLASNDQAAIAVLGSISPVAWRHVNLFGAMDFRVGASTVDMAALVARYADPIFWSRTLQEAMERQFG
jgi:TnpA family transposase